MKTSVENTINTTKEKVNKKNKYIYFLIFCMLMSIYTLSSTQTSADNNVPNDPYHSEQWYLDSYQESFGTNWEYLHSYIERTNIEPVNGVIRVAVFDTGENINHPDLINSIWVNPGEIANDGIDNDGNGYIDDTHGCAFTPVDNSCTDVNPDLSPTQHGTSVAGIIGAEIDNSVGISGMNTGYIIEIVIVKVNHNGIINFSSVREGLEYIKVLGDIDIVNMSFAAWPDSSYMTSINNLITEISNEGTVFIAGSGNSAETEEGVGWPARHDNVIAVGGYNKDGLRRENSSYGPKLDLVAPAESIRTICYQEEYCLQSGTSIASPMVVQAVGLIKAYRPDATFEEIQELLHQSSAREFTPEYGYGPLNFQELTRLLFLDEEVYLPVIQR